MLSYQTTGRRTRWILSASLIKIKWKREKRRHTIIETNWADMKMVYANTDISVVI